LPEYHRITESGAVLIPLDKHPAVSKGGKFAADITTQAGDPVYAPADGTIPHIYPDTLDGGVKGGAMFTFKVPPDKKGSPAIRFVLAHVVPEPGVPRKPKKGDVIGRTSGDFLHVGCNIKAQLELLLATGV
jgi:hypothetical protein